VDDTLQEFAMSAGSRVIPSFRYRDAPAAIVWLETVLGFARKAVYDGPNGTVGHAELTFGESGMVMLGSATNANPYPTMIGTPEEAGGRVTSPMYLISAETEALWERATAAGAEVVAPLRAMEYGGTSFTLRDPEGYLWSVGEYDPWNGSE
jgi:uncharacterized glyoxalase superfamily protein PhnB